jgi:hypothetical protein
VQTSRVGHIAAEFESLANVLVGRGCGNPAFITYPLNEPSSCAQDAATNRKARAPGAGHAIHASLRVRPGSLLMPMAHP